MSVTDLLMTVLHASKRVWRRAGWWRSGRQEHGVNTIEMTFVAMFVFVLIAGIVDVGGAYHDYIIAINSSREGARLYSRMSCTTSNRLLITPAVVAAVQGEATNNNLNLTAANVKLDPDPTLMCPVTNSTVRVTVTFNYSTMMGQFWGASTFPIRSQTSMMFYGAD